MSTLSEEIDAVLGFDSTSNRITASTLKEATDRLEEEQHEASVAKATEILKKLQELRKLKVLRDKEYQKQSKDWDNEVGKLLSRVAAITSGKQEPTLEPTTKEENKAS